MESSRMLWQHTKQLGNRVRFINILGIYSISTFRDYDSAVRLYLDKLNDPENAVRIVKQTRRSGIGI